MSTSTADEELDAEVIDLEPTAHITAEPWASRAASSSFAQDAVMAAGEAGHASLAGEIGTILRRGLPRLPCCSLSRTRSCWSGISSSGQDTAHSTGCS